MNRQINRSLIALLAALLILPSNLSWSKLQAAPQPQVAAPPKKAAAPPATVTTADDWPRLYHLTDGDSALIYQPQIASWDGQKRMVGWAAVSYQKKSAKQPTLGTVKLEADTKVALDERLVSFTPFQITEFNFQSLSADESREVVGELQKAIPTGDQVISLDHVLAGVDKSAIKPKDTNPAGLKADPPKIFYSAKAAVLMVFDGQPVWSPIKDNDLKFAVNTNWDLFEHTPSKTFYLRDDKSWLTATDIKGPWSPAGKLPASFSQLPADENWKDVLASLPGKKLLVSAVPQVFESFEPAELIMTAGNPAYSTVEGTTLLWVSNTDSDLFRDGAKGDFYYLVAGRWFSAPSLDGPWVFATPNLPEAFKRVPLGHPRSRILASVPGTDQAIEAVLLASVPQTARVNKKELKAPEVIYQGGAPEFKPIETTTLERAVNTDKDIIKLGDLYYMCFQGVWFIAKSAYGSWEVTSNVPKEIYAIPASSPAYNVTYVTVVEEEKDENADWVTFAAMAGYSGMMVGWGCAVWGSGWYYPPYIWYGGLYPWYGWYPPTYGFAAWYNPYTGTFGRGAAVYGPYGGAGGWAAYNPRTGTYARGGAVYGPYGSRSFNQAWNPRTGTYAQSRQGSNIYGNWGSSYVQRGDNWAQTGHITNYAKGRKTTGIRTSEGGGAIHTKSIGGGSSTLARTGSGDIYAGHDGNVYRKQDGTWQKWNGGGWSSVEKPEGITKDLSGKTRENLSGQTRQTGADKGSGSVVDQLDRDKKARSEGAQRTRDNQSYRTSPSRGRTSAGSFRGGGARMGGRRR